MTKEAIEAKFQEAMREANRQFGSRMMGGSGTPNLREWDRAVRVAAQERRAALKAR